MSNEQVNAEEDLEVLKKEHTRVLSDWFKDCEQLTQRIYRLEAEKEELRSVLSHLSFYVGSGLGDDSTPAKEYLTRIKEGIDSLKEIT